MNIALALIFLLLNLIVSHFFIWRYIKHDTEDVEGVRVTWKLLLGSWISGKIVWIVVSWINNSWSWIVLIDGVFYPSVAWGGIWIMLRHRTKKYKSKWQSGWNDSVAEGLLVLGFLESLRNLLWVRDWYQIVVIAVWVLLIIGVYWVKPRYRRFKLYASGKTGFVFWTSWIMLSILSILNLLIMGIKNGALIISIVICLVFLIIAIVGWYQRAGRKVSKDWPWLYYWFK